MAVGNSFISWSRLDPSWARFHGAMLHLLQASVERRDARRALGGWNGSKRTGRQLQAGGGLPTAVEGGHQRIFPPADEPASSLERSRRAATKARPRSQPRAP